MKIPLFFSENEILYGKNFQIPQIEDLTIPIGVARIIRTGKDVTLVSFSIGMNYVMEAADALCSLGIEAEVIDLRTLRPLDITTVVESVKKNQSLCRC